MSKEPGAVHDYFFEHGWFVYDATLRVPLVIKPPGRHRGRREDAQASNLDSLPTLLSMAGIALPPALPGRDLLASPKTVAVLVENPSTYPEVLAGLRTPERKFVRALGSGAEELYDLRKDPHERTNLVDRHPQLAGKLREELSRLRPGSTRAGGGEIEIEPTSEELELLKQLGYVDP